MKTIGLIFRAILLRFLFVSPFMLLFWWIHRSTRKLRPREDGDSVEFSLVPRMRILIEIVVVLLVAFSALVLIETIRSGQGLYAVLIPLSVLAAIILATPRSVLTDHLGVHQRHWLGNEKVIPWEDVAWMRRGRNTGTTYVKSSNGGRPVSFSPLLRGQSRFEHEVRKRTRGLDTERGLAHLRRHHSN
jgi:hypothetical protein